MWSLAFCLLLQTCLPPPTPIRVIGYGQTSEQARDNAYREAMETYIGSVVVSDKEMRDLTLVKNDVLVYSSAYVDKMRVISDSSDPRGRRVELDVWLSSSKIANRILTVFPKDQDLDSARIGEQFRTYASTKQKGDELIQRVVEIYPHNAYTVDVRQTEFKVDPYRVPYLRVSYTLKWNKNYFLALEETIKAISDGKSARKNAAASVLVGGGSSWFLQPYYFNDVIPVQIIYNRFDNKKVAVKLTVTQENQVMFSTCQSTMPNYFYGPGHSNLDLAGDKVFNGEFNVKVPGRIDPNMRTSVTIASEDQCAS